MRSEIALSTTRNWTNNYAFSFSLCISELLWTPNGNAAVIFFSRACHFPLFQVWRCHPYRRPVPLIVRAIYTVDGPVFPIRALSLYMPEIVVFTPGLKHVSTRLDSDSFRLEMREGGFRGAPQYLRYGTFRHFVPYLDNGSPNRERALFQHLDTPPGGHVRTPFSGLFADGSRRRRPLMRNE